MKKELKTGLRYEHTFIVPSNKTVPHLYPEAEELSHMPEVFATGYLVGLFEWACIKAINPYLDWPSKQSVGISIDISHEAATPPGFTVTVFVELIEIEGKKLTFSLKARDDYDFISRGKHERFIIDKEKFDARLQNKISRKS